MFGKNLKSVELLSPAGNFEALIAAVNAGCDAVYFGGKRFNAREYASNFSDDEIKNIIDYCHLRGVKVRVALNILYKNSEINDVLDFVSKLCEFGADALIIQDIGLFSIVKNNFEINLHASTQMTVHNKNSAEFLRFLGFNRIVLSRELSLKEIKEIKEYANIEIETFIHGAICVSYSGRCFMSSIIGGRSGNRGRCAQPCRLKYSIFKDGDKKSIKDGYLISPKDMYSLPIMDELLKSGIDSFKIEGRMKNPEYVGLVTSIYRKYIDKININSDIEKKDIKELTQIFNRGGSLETGYYNNYAGIDMISLSPKSSGVKIGVVDYYNPKSQKCIIKLEDDVFCGDGIEIWTKTEPHTGSNISKNAKKGEKITLKLKADIKKGDMVYKSFDKILNDKLKHFYEKNTRQQVINAEVTAVYGKKFKIRLFFNECITDVEDDIVEKAKNAPLTKKRLLSQLSKTGDTPFKFNFIKSEIGNNIYIPLGNLNKIKRKAVEELSKTIIKYYERDKINFSYNFKPLKKADMSKISVLANTVEQLEVCLDFDISRIYIEFKDCFLDNITELTEKCHSRNIEIFASMPWIDRDIYRKDTLKAFNILENSKLDGYLIRNYEKINTKKQAAADFTFNVFNSASLNFLNEFYDIVCLSPELNVKELNQIAQHKSEIFVYGRLPLMTTHQCPIGIHCDNKNGRYCSLKNHKDNYYIKDRKNTKFPILTDCDRCVSVIMNSVPIFVLKRFNEIKNLGARFLRLNFTDESADVTKEIIYGYLHMLLNDEADFRTNNIINKILEENGATGGHFFRGVL